ncbi:hypothetical protein GCM10020000_72590 [Streptomyces olivoverticillatus]
MEPAGERPSRKIRPANNWPPRSAPSGRRAGAPRNWTGGEEGRDARGARERRRLGRAARRLHLNVRGGRLARAQDPGPVPRDLRLPPLPEREGPGWEEPED